MHKLDRLTIASSIVVALAFLGAFYVILTDLRAAMPLDAKLFMMGWLGLSLIASVFVSPRNRVLGYLLALFALLVGWRIGGLYGTQLIIYGLLVAFIFYVIEFFGIARQSLAGAKGAPAGLAEMTSVGWHLTFVRLYIGLDFVPHFTEKLFAGAGPHMDDVKAFEQLGASAPDFLVWLAGLCELGAAIGIGLGLLTRLTAIGAALYLLIASLMGHHFELGFIWANTGGGWEYPILWIVLVLSFAFAGAGPFSIDAVIRRNWKLPGWVEMLMYNRKAPWG